MRAAATITLTANQAVSWTNITLTRPDGSVTQLAASSGQSATWSLANAVEGLYVVRGTLTAGGSSTDVLTHFTVWVPPTTGTDASLPPVQKNAVPFAAGELKSSDGERFSSGRAASSATRSSSRSRRSRRTPCRVSRPGSLVVNVSAFLRSTHAPVHDLGGVADIRFMNAGSGAHPVTSVDGKTWRDIPQLPTLNLPDGQADGWFLDSDGTVHVLARHLSYYALVGRQVSTRLAMRIMTVRRLWLANRSFVAVRMSLTGAGTRDRLVRRPDGSIVPGQTIKTPTRHAGVTILRVPLKITKPGLYKLQMHADGARPDREPHGEDPLHRHAAGLADLAGRRRAGRGRPRRPRPRLARQRARRALRRQPACHGRGALRPRSTPRVPPRPPSSSSISARSPPTRSPACTRSCPR